ncbi:MAG: MarR family transcriptional regulator [Ornithinimicrobium sp.]
MNITTSAKLGARSSSDQYVERMGMALGSGSLTRGAGRLLGWLLICEPPVQSVDQLSAALNASPATVSGTATELVRAGLVERVGVSGSRRTHYQLRADAWRSVLATPRQRATDLRELAEEGLSLLQNSAPERRERLMSMHHLFAFVEAEFLTAPRRYTHTEGSDHE